LLPAVAIVVVSPAANAHCEDKAAVGISNKAEGDAGPALNQHPPAKPGAAASRPHAGPPASSPVIVIPRQL